MSAAKRSARTLAPLAIVGAITAAGCGDDEAVAKEGEVVVTVYGESFIEDGIPASEMGDGWSVEFERFVVSLADVKVGDTEIAVTSPIDISGASDGVGHMVGTGQVPEGSHSAPSFTITQVSLAGVASKDEVTKSFDWTIEAPTAYANCETTTEVVADQTAEFQVTVHADHFFYDSLVAEDPAVLFQALADADADEDGVITQAELEATDIGGYDPGSAGDVDNLWAWLVAQSGTLGHVDGEGHCDASVQSQ